MAHLLFVYGTLRRDADDALGHPLRRALAAHAEWVDRGQLAGELFDVGDYPGAVANAGGSTWVRGDLYRIRRPEALLPALDAYEGCEPHRHDPEYRRERLELTGDRLGACEAWVYVYNHSVAGLPRVLSGDYLRRPGANGEGARLDAPAD
jgi:gamma-glutamylcyclotransferase (GGCT)/AIG2-like uncharacterized protein YtfP